MTNILHILVVQNATQSLGLLFDRYSANNQTEIKTHILRETLVSYIKKYFLRKMTRKQQAVETKKLVVIGDGMCGKTCLLIVFQENKFPMVFE